MSGIILFLFFGVLVIQLFNIQIINHDYYEQQAINQQTAVITVNADRGTIYDRNGIVLAESATAYKVYIVPNRIAEEEKETVIDGLSGILGLKRETMENAVAKTQSSYVAVARRIEPSVATEVRAFIKENKLTNCVNVTDDPKRYYPFGSLASHVLGFVGDDNQGLYGVEAQYDAYLGGTAGRIISTRASGSSKYLIPYDNEMYIEPVNGQNVTLTIDQVVQYTVENYLREYQNENGSRNRSASVVMNVKTGEILAMATMPDFDLNEPFTLTDFYAARLEKDNSNYTDLLYEMWRNKVVSEIYEPGSVFKTVTAALALELDVCSPDHEFYCPGYHVVAGVRIRCAKRSGHGRLTFAGALAYSCNPSFMTIAEMIGGDNMFSFIKSLGIGSKTGIDLPSEEAGFFFTRSNYNATEIATSSFGQQFKVSMIQMLQIVSSYANGGMMVKPHVVKEITASDGSLVDSFGTTEVKQIVSKETAEQVLEMMVGVVEDGTGTNARVSGYLIAGKSGTSEKLDKRDKDGNVWLYITSFLSIAPADDPEIAVLSVFDEPIEPNVAVNYYSSATRLNRDILTAILPYLGLEPNREVATKKITVANYVGQNTADAKKAVSDAGLAVKVVGTGEKIKYQFPKKGEKVLPGTVVNLYTDTVDSIKAVEIPDVIGKSLDEARKLLNAKGFNIKLKEDYKDLKDVIVVAEEPAAGEFRPAGDLVTLELYYPTDDYNNVFD